MKNYRRKNQFTGLKPVILRKSLPESNRPETDGEVVVEPNERIRQVRSVWSEELCVLRFTIKYKSLLIMKDRLNLHKIIMKLLELKVINTFNKYVRRKLDL